MHEYDDSFFDWVDSGARRSAEKVIPAVLRSTDVTSVIDIGCGRGTWLAIWLRNGVTDIAGVDGPYVDMSKLHIPREAFYSGDLSKHLTFPRRFSLAQSLEVGEHLPEMSAPHLVSTLCALSDVVVFSAAVPGQGGENHINEQEPGWWQQRFSALGYSMFDCVRPAVANDMAVEPWYRYNTFIYANEGGIDRLKPGVAETLVPAGSAPKDYSTLGWRLRRAVLKPLPVPVVSFLSRLNYSILTKTRSRSGHSSR